MIELKIKKCEVCGTEFNNRRKNGQSFGDSQFLKKRFCSLKCSGLHQRGISKPLHTDEWKKAMSKRLKKEHADGLRKYIFTAEVKEKMSISAKKRGANYFPKKGKENSLWRGDNISYENMHKWVKKILGSPKVCSHCKTEKARKYEWASINHEYKRDLSNWVRLCTKCHRNYDYGNITLDIPT